MESKGFQSHLSVGNVALMGGSEKFPDVMLGLNQLEKCFSLIYHEKLPSSGKQIEKKKAYFGCLKVKQFNSAHCQACRASWLFPAFLFISEPASEQEKCGCLQCFCLTKPRLANSIFNSALQTLSAPEQTENWEVVQSNLAPLARGVRGLRA